MSGTGGDMSQLKQCPGCGEMVSNVTWPRHFRSEDCGGAETDESGGQSDLTDWGADK